VKILITILVIISLVFVKTLIKLFVNRNRVDREIKQTSIKKIHAPGHVKKFTFLPLIDFYAKDKIFKTEAGVSYHMTTDDMIILMDLGANGRKEHPSPLMQNMASLGKRFEDLNAIFISHAHLDHVGGMKEQRGNRFSVSKGPVTLPAIPVYSPVSLRASDQNPLPDVRVITEPHVIAPGIISIGAIPRALYLLGYTLENSLAFNVEEKGIVIVIGCGHQTIQRIIERVQALFDQPIYAIIGGLHLPSGGGRMKIGPIDIQPIVGSDRVPWKRINDQDTEDAIAAIQKVDPALIALSPHDSSDRSLARFREVFKDRFQVIEVGKVIEI